MAKVRGKQRWNNNRDLWHNLMAAEIILDSLQQKYTDDYTLQKKLSRALGYIRSCLAQVDREQDTRQLTLKRWINPAPSQVQKQKKHKDT